MTAILGESRGTGKLKEWQKRILAALTDEQIIAAYESLGCPPTREPNANGWKNGRAIDREDKKPSAGFNVGDGPARGRYKDFTGENISLFDAAMKFGDFADWRAARDYFAELAGVPYPFARRSRREPGPDRCRAAARRREARRELEVPVLPVPSWYVPRCPRAMTIRITYDDEGRERVAETRCGSWSCPHCSFHSRERWLRHFAEVMPSWVYIFTPDPETWASIKRDRGRKWFGSYARSFLGFEYLLITSDPLPDSDGRVIDEPVGRTRALRILAKSLAAMPLDLARPISTSADWRPREEKRKGNGRLAGIVHTTPEEAERQAKRLGLDVRDVDLDGGRRIRRCVEVQGHGKAMERFRKFLSGGAWERVIGDPFTDDPLKQTWRRREAG